MTDLVGDVESIFPSQNPACSPAAFYHHHAHVWQSMGDFAQARQLYRHALDCYLPDQTRSPQFATTLDALANVCLEDGDWQAAEPLYERARTIYEASPHSYPVRHAYAAFNLGRCRDMSGRLQESVTLFAEACERFRALANTHPREYAGFLVTWARLHCARGRHDDGRGLLEEALEAYARLDAGLDGHATVLVDLAVCAADTGDRTASIAYLNRAIAEHEVAFGSRHPNTAYAMHLQATFWLQDNPMHRNAASQLAECVTILTESIGAEHDWTRQAQAALTWATQLSSTSL